MELFAKIVKGLKPFNIFVKSSTLEVLLGSECAFDTPRDYKLTINLSFYIIFWTDEIQFACHANKDDP